ncbi:hypothetical protein ACVWWJ_002474 [Luteibacter sp. HA06]
MDGNTKVSDVLRKALVVSKKLRIPDLAQWIRYELDGYGTAQVPPYRQLNFALRVWNRFHGWQPLLISDAKIALGLSRCSVGQPLGQLEDLMTSGDGTPQVPFRAEQEALLMSRMEVPLRPTRIGSRTDVQGIVEAVRNQVLNWSLDLESRGVVGEGMTFTAQEREAAHRVTNITNNIGSMSNSQLQQASPNANQQQTIERNSSDLLALIQAIETVSLNGLSRDDAAELRAEIETFKAQARSPKPKVTVIGEGLKSVRAILERSAGSIVSSEVLPLVIDALHRYAG